LKFEREREKDWEWGRGRGRRKESQADPTWNAEPDAGLDPMTLRSQRQGKPRVGCLTD